MRMLRTKGKQPLYKRHYDFYQIVAKIQYNAVNCLFSSLMHKLRKSNIEHHHVEFEFQAELCAYAYVCASRLNTCVLQPCCRVSRSKSQSGAT